MTSAPTKRNAARPEAPEFATLTPSSKSLARKLGNIPEQTVSSATGTPGPGWLALEDAGWIRIREEGHGGYEIGFTLSGWERWCRQCDAEDGQPLQPIEFD